VWGGSSIVLKYPCMQKNILLQKEPVPYTLRVSGRARAMRLTIVPGGVLIVTAPARMSQSTIEQFIFKKSRWVLDKLAYAKKFSPLRLVTGGKRDFALHKAQALALARERVTHFNLTYGFSFKRISIKNTKSRWGSCSRKGNLNFNYRILFLPSQFSDYIIAHELCHLGEFNHSLRFWTLVAKTIPDYAGLRRELRKKIIS